MIRPRLSALVPFVVSAALLLSLGFLQARDAARFPGMELGAFNLGIAGDWTSGAIRRYYWDILDARGPSVLTAQNVSVENLARERGGISFDCLERTLPFPVDKEFSPALDWVPLMKEFNQVQNLTV